MARPHVEKVKLYFLENGHMDSVIWGIRLSRPYALCVTLFNVSRRLILGAYCVVIGGIPTHSEGILAGHEVAKSQVVNQTQTTSLIELYLQCRISTGCIAVASG